MIALIAALLSPAELRMPETLKPIAKTQLAAIDELSGITPHGTMPGWYWVHNDSGDQPRLFCINTRGDVAFKGWENRKADAGQSADAKPYEGIKIHGAVNQDWEDITRIGDTLYISDLGNNDNYRRDLAVYAVKEPNPLAAREAFVLERITVHYPEQRSFPPTIGDWEYDCEAIFAHRGKLHFLTKVRAANTKAPVARTVLYRLDRAVPGQSNALKRVTALDGLGGWVTGADASPDGKTLAILTHVPRSLVWFVDLTQPERIWNETKWSTGAFTAGQCEAVTFENATNVLVTNEPGELFRVPVPARLKAR
ncbi:MAG: hypothetical protein SFX74_09755 [Fimbriimonadaceae bacterium]|nr:hypothetical protein [Fimbriimonadaceae bacterium]